MLLFATPPAAPGPTGTSQSFSASSGCDIGHDAGADEFAGRMQHLAIYDAALPAATALAHYQRGITYAPEDFTMERASDGVVGAVYARTSTGDVVGWATSDSAPHWEAGQTQALLTTAEIEPYFSYSGDDASIRLVSWRVAAREQSRNNRIDSSSFTVYGIKGWRPGQTVYLRDSRLTDGAWETQVTQHVAGEVGFGDVLSYRITAGAPARSLVQTVSGQ